MKNSAVQASPEAKAEFARTGASAGVFLFSGELLAAQEPRNAAAGAAALNRRRPSGYPRGTDRCGGNRAGPGPQGGGGVGLEDRVRVAGYLSQEVIAEIYRHSCGLPFVSRYEGFGIPILEAFRTGTPVICSRNTSCPEVAGRAALFVDETDARDIAAALDRVLTDEPLRQELIRKGRGPCRKVFLGGRGGDHMEGLERAVRGTEPPPPWVRYGLAPLITVVTPSYNQGRFIRATIRQRAVAGLSECRIHHHGWGING